MAVCPAYWLTSYSLLIDSALVAFLLGLSMDLCHRAGTPEHGLGPGQRLLMGLTMGVKYFGVIVVPIALSWQLVDPERRKWLGGYLAYGFSRSSSWPGGFGISPPTASRTFWRRFRGGWNLHR